jgi:putative ABC transport system permease protein
MQYKDKVFEEKQCSYADPEIFDILTIPLTQGDLSAIRQERNFFIISETLARKYFGSKNPMGETITVKCRETAYEMKVTAVMKSIPATSTFTADAIGPLYIAEKFLSDIYGKARVDGPQAWTSTGPTTYAVLPPSARTEEVDAKLLALSKRHMDPTLARSFALFPLRQIYFHSSHMVNSPFRHGNITNVYIYSAAAFFLLFIACVNYLMLSLGRASLRTREVGVRKVFGALKSDLFQQTLVEAMVVTFISLPIALVLVELLLQDLTGLLGSTIAGAYFHTWEYFLGFVVITIAVGLVAGSYVSLYLSSFNPIDILKSNLAAGSRKVFLRRLLMMSQMIIFLGLTLTSLTVYKQLRLFQNGDMGFDRENLVVFYPEKDDFAKTFEVFKNEIQKNPEIVSVSGANQLPMTESRGVTRFPRKDHSDQSVTVEGMSTDRDVIETMGMKMISGVSFRNHNPGVAGHYCIINETAAKELGLTDPVGEKVGESTVIGVVGDFNMHSFHESIGPLQIKEDVTWIQEVAVRMSPGNIQGTAKWIAERGARFNKGKPLEFELFDERLGDLYRHEQSFAKTIGYATGLAIFIACLGIFGMSVFVCQQKVKEIGIRKVLGAATRDVYYRLTKEFVGLILLSSLVAFPLASYIVTIWLEQFVYRIDISVWDILLTAIVDIVVVLATVSYQTVKAASVNPVVCLRYE